MVYQPDEINNEIGSHLKNLLYSKINNGSELLDMNDENKKQYLEHARTGIIEIY